MYKFMNRSVIACSVLAEPRWRSYQMSRRDGNAICGGSAEKAAGLMASFDFGLANESEVRRRNAIENEDFLIEDLSEFGIASDYGSPLQQNSDIKSDCTNATIHASSSASDLLQHSEFVAKTALLGHEIQESPLCLPDEDDTGFDWLGSLGDDNLIYTAAPNLDMDSFLLSTAMPFSGTFDGMKHTDYENAILSEQDVEMRQTFMRAACGMTPECRQADNERCSRIDCRVAGLQTCNATDSAAPTVMTSKSARSKRTRSVSGWSSGGFLCERWPENPSPTHSLQSSTSQASNEFAKCASQCQGCTTGFMCSQEDGYTTSSHDINMEIKFDANLIDKPNGDIDKKLGSDETYLNKENSARGEAVSNSYSGGTLQPRRCTHCLSHKTPQWRAGPMGPKTLCNACGVRFKSGRLFEEYRPAKSPTFLSCKHSSSHKKVMEMRRRKAFHYNQHQRSQHMPLQHRVRASPMMQTDGNNPSMIGNFKVKLDTPAPRARVEVACSTIFSDVTLIRTRNALESPSNCL